MGLFDRVERRLERAVNGAFARAFKAEVQPVEIAAAMRRAMDDRAAVLGHGRTIVPNLFTVELAPSDYERLDAYSEVLSDELVASAQEHAESQRYQPGGPIAVQLQPRTTTSRPGSSGSARPPPAAPTPAPDRPRPSPSTEPAAWPEPRVAGPVEPAPAAAPASRHPRPGPRPARTLPRRRAPSATRSSAPGWTSTASATRCSAPSRCSAATTRPTSSSTTRASRGGTPRSG